MSAGDGRRQFFSEGRQAGACRVQHSECNKTGAQRSRRFGGRTGLADARIQKRILEEVFRGVFK
jgi:hypothetical protein